MPFRYYFRNDDGDMEEFTDRVQVGWANRPGTTGLVMNAEEGSVGSSELQVEDPDGDFFISGHRAVIVIESDADYDDYGGIVYSGYTTQRVYQRDAERLEAARTIALSLVDINSIFERRIQVGAENKRPAETDVERVEWLLTTNEAALIDDDQYFSTDGPFDMDAVDYRGQGFRQIFDDVSQQSGKNWYLWPSLGGYSLWYGPRGTDDFSSEVLISNDLADLSAYEYEGNIYAPAIESKLTRDPSRVYSGTYLAYASSFVYVQRESTAEAFARRDSFTSAPNVKTKAKATTRANRILSDIDTEEDVISTAIIVRRTQVNAVIQGQRLQVKFTHFPGYEDWTWVRVLNRTVRELGPDQIELAMELSPEEPVDTGGGGASNTYGILRRSWNTGPYPTCHWHFPGDNPEAGYAYEPTVGLITPYSDSDSLGWAPYIYIGWLIGGTGTIDVTYFNTTIGVTPTTVTFNITKNYIPIASEVQAGAVGNDGLVTATGISVVPGDLIGATVLFDPQSTPFAMSPRGTGQAGERLEITGGNLS